MTTYIQFSESTTGMDTNGQPVEVSKTILVRPDDVAKMQRLVLFASQGDKALTMQDADLIELFLTTHLARIVQRQGTGFNERGDMMISYDMHLAWLQKQAEGARSELHGFMQAKIGKPVQWSSNQYEQDRFMSGYRDGLAKLMQDEVYNKQEA